MFGSTGFAPPQAVALLVSLDPNRVIAHETRQLTHSQGRLLPHLRNPSLFFSSNQAFAYTLQRCS